jgi:hypothetical protein
VCCYALEAARNAEVPLDQASDLLDHQVGVLREGVQHLSERLKGRQRVKEAFHKLLLLLAWDAHFAPPSAAGCPSVPCWHLQSKSTEGFPKGLVTEPLHNGSNVLLTTHAFDLQKFIKPGEQQVRCNAPVPATMMRDRYTSFHKLLTNACLHIVRKEAVLSIQLLFQIRNQLLQALFRESLLNPNFEFGSAGLHSRHHTKHYDKNAR